MHPLILLLSELFVGALVALTASLSLFAPMREVITDLCGTPTRGRFWTNYAVAMIFLTALLAVMLFSRGDAVADLAFYKRAFTAALVGVFVALAFVGQRILRFIPDARQAEHAMPNFEKP
ncbi:hypothetical protein R0381_003554 [Jeongeupia wiesaeckerbachi]|uniref:hypothetical protein n=1 Tax=Jeongeupia wiesaeckerbachi TaxID=3051218 RepID=UPI003D806B6B